MAGENPERSGMSGDGQQGDDWPANSEYAKRLTTIANALGNISTVSR